MMGGWPGWMMMLVVSFCRTYQTQPVQKMEARVVRWMDPENFLVAGIRRRATRVDRDILVMRLSREGRVRWARVVGGHRRQEVWDGVVFPGGSVWVGMAEQSPKVRAWGEADALAFRLDEEGRIQWVRLWGGRGEDVATAIARDPKGNLWVAGTSFRRVEGARLPHLFVVALKAESGELLLSRRYLVAHASAWLRVHRMVADPSGGFWLVGAISPKGKEDADLWVVRLDDQGRPRWMERLGGEGRQMARDAVPDGKGGVFILGNIRKFRGVLVEKDDILLLHMDSQGDVTWMGRFGTTGVDQGEGLGRVGHSLVGVGWSRGAGGRGEGLLFEIRTDGTDLQAWTVGGPREDRLKSIDVWGDRWASAGWSLSWGTPLYAFSPSLWVLTGRRVSGHCEGCGKPLTLHTPRATFRLHRVAYQPEWRAPTWLRAWVSPGLLRQLQPLLRWVFRKGEQQVLGRGHSANLPGSSLDLGEETCAP